MKREVTPRDGKGSPIGIGQLTEHLIPTAPRQDPPLSDAEVERRTIRGGPGGACVFVPPPPPHPNDRYRDVPPGFPPELRHMSMRSNYNAVITWGYRFDSNGEPTKAEPELLAWLDGIQPEIERIRSQLG